MLPSLLRLLISLPPSLSQFFFNLFLCPDGAAVPLLFLSFPIFMAGTFGTGDISNLDPAHLRLFQSLDKAVSSRFQQLSLHDIPALTSETDLVDLLLDNDLLALSAVVAWFSATAPPSVVDVVAFMNTLGITWVRSAGPDLDRDQLLVAMRVKQFVASMFELNDKRLSGTSMTADPMDMDTPLEVSIGRTMDSAFLAQQHRPVQPLLLPPPSVCGNLRRQFESGVFVEVALKYVVLHKESADRWHGTQIISEISSGKHRVVGKAPTKDVKSMLDAYLRLAALSYGRVYIGSTFAAPLTAYPGNASVGVLNGVRVQYDMQSHESYLGLLQEVATLLGDRRGEFTYRFSTLAKRTHDLTRAGRSYADAQADAASNLFAFMRAPAPFVAPSLTPQKPGGKGDGGSSVDPAVTGAKRTLEDLAKIPGFIKGLRTFGSDKECASLAAKAAGKSKFCPFFVTARACNYGSDCKKAHLCDVKLADNSLCLQSHTRAKHVEELGLPEYP